MFYKLFWGTNSLRRNPHRLFHGVAQILFCCSTPSVEGTAEIMTIKVPKKLVKVNKHKKSGSFWVSRSWFLSKLTIWLFNIAMENHNF